MKKMLSVLTVGVFAVLAAGAGSMDDPFKSNSAEGVWVAEGPNTASKGGKNYIAVSYDWSIPNQWNGAPVSSVTVKARVYQIVAYGYNPTYDHTQTINFGIGGSACSGSGSAELYYGNVQASFPEDNGGYMVKLYVIGTYGGGVGDKVWVIDPFEYVEFPEP